MDLDGFSPLAFVKGMAWTLGILLFMWAMIKIGTGGKR